MIDSFVHGGKIVASVGSHNLYESDVEAYIPDGISVEDSTKLALQYINSWASEMVFTDAAEKELSKPEKNVDSELEDYRRSLLKYRYEQKFVNQRLDTSVTADQIEKYYEGHIENFKLRLPIVKVKFMSISGDSPNLEIIRKKMMSDNPEDQMEADSIAFSSAFRYTDFGGNWIDFVKLSNEFGTDYGTVFSAMKDGWVEIRTESGILNMAHVGSLICAGETGPVEYYRERIKDIILSTRKQALLNGLERDLLENARRQGTFVVRL